MLNSVRRLPIRNAFNMCRRSFVETVGDDVYSADLSQNRKVTLKNVFLKKHIYCISSMELF